MNKNSLKPVFILALVVIFVEALTINVNAEEFAAEFYGGGGRPTSLLDSIIQALQDALDAMASTLEEAAEDLEGGTKITCPNGDHVWTQAIVSEANCKNPAIYIDRCTKCGEETGDAYTIDNKKGDHIWETIEASCGTKGYQITRCKICQKEKEKKYIGSFQHEYESGYYNRGSSKGHSDIQICKVCKDNKLSSKILPHTFIDGVCVCGAYEAKKRPTIEMDDVTLIENNGSTMALSRGENQDEDSPLTVYFGGAGAIDHLEGSINNINKRGIYDGLETDLIIPSNTTGKNDKAREEAAADAFLEYYLNSEYKDKPLYIDGHSNGGYGAMYLAKKAAEQGIEIKQLVLADANFNVKELEEFVETNPDTHVYNTTVSGSKTTSSTTFNSRVLNESENYTGQFVAAGHVNALTETLQQTSAMDERIAETRE